MKLCNFKGVIERNDCEIRNLEMLKPRKSILCGENPPEEIIITENGLHFSVNLLEGQKTGFYLDQRDNRAELAKFAKPDMEMLDTFCFSGAFSVYALNTVGKLNLNLLDESQNALNLAEKNLKHNKISPNSAKFYRADAFSMLRKFRDRGKKFDLIVLDPPKFAPTRKNADKASRGYKDINLLAIKLLQEVGILATFSCSSGISPEKFRQIVGSAAQDSGKELKILRTLGQGADHPVPLNFPEAQYLKGLICTI